MAGLRDFFKWLLERKIYEADHIERLKDEWLTLSFGDANDIIKTVQKKDYPLLFSLYDQRIAIMTEGRQPTEEEIISSWKCASKEVSRNG